jgi:hypothetical protein
MSYDNLSSVSQNVLKFYQQLTGEERSAKQDACVLIYPINKMYAISEKSGIK